jgi:hypothetical protein
MTDTKICPYCGEEVKAAAIKCKHCHSMLSEEDKVPVGAPAPAKPEYTTPKTKKPIWKQWWVWAAVFILFIAIVVSGGNNDKKSVAGPGEVVEVQEQVLKESEEEVAEEPVEAPNTTETSSGETDSATLGEKNAAKSASNYLDIMPFSYSGLVKQLEFEGYTQEEAVYGVDKCDADWNEQAAKSASNYLDIMPFSRTELISQLEFEGFTRQQAEYGVQAVGY